MHKWDTPHVSIFKCKEECRNEDFAIYSVQGPICFKNFLDKVAGQRAIFPFGFLWMESSMDYVI